MFWCFLLFRLLDAQLTNFPSFYVVNPLPLMDSSRTFIVTFSFSSGSLTDSSIVNWNLIGYGASGQATGSGLALYGSNGVVYLKMINWNNDMMYPVANIQSGVTHTLQASYYSKSTSSIGHVKFYFDGSYVGMVSNPSSESATVMSTLVIGCACNIFNCFTAQGAKIYSVHIYAQALGPYYECMNSSTALFSYGSAITSCRTSTISPGSTTSSIDSSSSSMESSSRLLATSAATPSDGVKSPDLVLIIGSAIGGIIVVFGSVLLCWYLKMLSAKNAQYKAKSGGVFGPRVSSNTVQSSGSNSTAAFFNGIPHEESTVSSGGSALSTKQFTYLPTSIEKSKVIGTSTQSFLQPTPQPSTSDTIVQNEATMVFQNQQKELSLPGHIYYERLSQIVTMGKKLASGGSGGIFIGQSIVRFENGQLPVGSNVAIKILDQNKLTAEQFVTSFRQEVAITYYFNKHPNIVKVFAFADSPYSMVLKLYSNGSFKNFISGSSDQRYEHINYYILQDILCGLIAVHNAGIAHMDIKPDNVLLDKKERLIGVLCDFSVSAVLNKDLNAVDNLKISNLKGLSASYAAPEMIMTLRSSGMPSICSFPIDIFSFGIVTWESAMRRSPALYPGMNDQLNAISSGQRPVVLPEEHLKLSAMSIHILKLASECWHAEPKRRLTAHQALETLKSFKRKQSGVTS